MTFFVNYFINSEAIGQPVTEIYKIIDKKSHNPVDNIFCEILENRNSSIHSSEILLISKQKEHVPVSYSGAPIFGPEGNITGAVIVFRNITDKRELEMHLRQQQKLTSIGTLASGIAHEINNPINIIMNYGQLILDGSKNDGDNAVNAREIISECERIAAIVRNLLSFASQEKESHSLSKTSDILDASLLLIKKVLQKDQITLSINIPDDLPMIFCRSQQIQQVIMHLITNAHCALNMRYPEFNENKILIISACQISKNDRNWLRITVEDHGLGVSPKTIEHIFDPLFTSRSIDTGTGLGLFVSQGIAKEHGGSLAVESHTNEYTRFHLDLPLNSSKKERHVNNKKK
ncbi:MAG: ATP-binding protein [Candidatus Theseobacter exili]|nr:ATP-binding protein [Candidatus Theseobacter exili]